MEKEGLKVLVDQLEKSCLPADAHFELKALEGPYDGLYIKANKEGLIHFSKQILKAAIELDENKELTKVDLSEEEDEIWLGGDWIIHYVEPLYKKGEEAKQEAYTNNKFKDRVMESSCAVLFIFLAISLIVGIVTIGKGMYDLMI